jgi:anaerobic selenocysteine-containing dehydrogenase
MPEKKTVNTICNMCTNHCGVKAWVEDGKVTKIDIAQEHPFHNLCIKAYAMPEEVYSRERLANPLRKEKGKFREVSWEEAFSFIGDSLRSIKQKYGPEATVFYLGQPTYLSPVLRTMTRRFADLYGTPNWVGATFECFMARVLGSVLTCGTYPGPDFMSADTKCIMVWGKNPPETFASERDAMNIVIGREAKLIVIDPRVTPLAKKADIHAQIRPGTDTALALGLLNVIVTEKLYDEGFIEQYTLGFDKLVDYAKEFSPEKVEQITWIPADTIRDIAQMFATTKPACVNLGISLEHCTNGIQAIRAITTLIAVTGNLDIAGGNLIVPGPNYDNLRVREKISQHVTIADDYPVYNKYLHEITASALTEAILNEKPYPIKGLVIIGSNPAVSWPNSNKLKGALKKLDFLLVEDIFMNETAEMADIILPGTTFLETDELRDVYFSHETIALVAKANKVIEPVSNSKEDWKIWVELGRRMGYKEYFPWETSNEVIADMVKPMGITLDHFRQHPGGIYYAQREYQKYIKEGFATPSGKIEIFSEDLARYGYDPIPTFHEPIESPVSRPDIAEKYPLILITGCRTVAYTNSRFRNLPSLRNVHPEPLIEINSQMATNLGIVDGQMVTVETLRGSVKVKAKLTEDIHPEVVSMTHGWSNASGANANCLTDNESVDPISGFPGFRSVLCRIVRE